MKQIDTNKIKTMVNDRIAYDLYERNRTMKKIKLKKAAFSIAVCILILGGIGTVDAATDGKISNTVKNTIKVIFTDENNQEANQQDQSASDKCESPDFSYICTHYALCFP